MSLLKCTNIDCLNTLPIAKVKLVMRNGELVPADSPICNICGDFMSIEIDETPIQEISVSQGRFASMTEAEKKDTLKKRARKHFIKNDKAAVEQKRQGTINEIKQQFEKGGRL